MIDTICRRLLGTLVRARTALAVDHDAPIEE